MADLLVGIPLAIALVSRTAMTQHFADWASGSELGAGRREASPWWET
jgi:hypothetical protein